MQLKCKAPHALHAQFLRRALAAAFVGMFLSSLHAWGAERTVLDGVYSEQQAQRGKRAYDRYCKQCHLSDLQGNALEPPLVSQWFLDAWREDYLWSLYDFIQTRMPKSKQYRPGSLKPQETLDILAYILSYNDFPSGANALTLDDLPQVLLVAHDGPKPLPANAMVRTVGCLQAMEQGHRLEHGAAPARVRTGDETDAAELAHSVEQSLGEHSLSLLNLDVLTTSEPLATMVGRKVQAKGVLNSLGKADARLFVLSLEAVGECSL